MTRHIIALLKPSHPLLALLLLLSALSLPAMAELPAYNTKIPTSFAGKLESFNTPDGGVFNIYVSGPDNSKASIVMIHEWWGLNPHIKGLADQLGALGYRVYAVDLYDGKLTDDPGAASMYMKMDDPAKSLAKLKTAIGAAFTRHGRVATIGWCFGGGWSLKASLAEPEKVAATVVYYGALAPDPEQLKRLRGPVLGIFGTQDKWINPAMVADFEKGLTTAGIEHKVKSYEADHAFANPSGDRFSMGPAQDAWKITLEFLAGALLGVKQEPK